MKLFKRSGVNWLFLTSTVYFVTGMIDIFLLESNFNILLQIIWISVIGMPFLIPPLGRWLNLDVDWDRKMLNWLKKKEVPKYLPEGLGVPKVTEDPESKKETKDKEPNGRTMYSIGLTDNNRVSFKMGYSEITMNSLGVQNLVDQLELFKKQIIEEARDRQNDQSQS